MYISTEQKGTKSCDPGEIKTFLAKMKNLTNLLSKTYNQSQCHIIKIEETGAVK